VPISNLITPQHLTRLAVIYIRQSSPQQVISNQESLRLQYALQQRAQELGWPPDKIQVIDTDLGLTAAAASHRAGFRALLAQVTLGEVGIILSLDVTRLSRNCSDWYPLLDLCGFRHCLIGDYEAIYDPGTPDGRLLLGLKGQLSELELHTIRARLTAGLLNKAARGELALQLPVGLVRDERGTVRKDPNLEVQQQLELVFTTLLAVRSASKTAKVLNDQQLCIPRRNHFGEVIWKRPTIGAVLLMLRNPAYAGAFVYGRRQSVRKDLAHRPLQRPLPLTEWKQRVNDKYPAYLSWETYEKIQQMLDDNRAEYTRERTRGVPREGAALLQGIVFCGESGHKMSVQYKPGPHYRCAELRSRYGVPVCQHTPAEPMDRCVVQAFFAALSPVELNLYECALETEKADRARFQHAQQQQLERLRYEAALAERQYRRVDPDNRLVAAELERRWEEALRTLQAAEESQQRSAVARPSFSLAPQLKAALLDLGRQLPEIWETSLLSRAQKKALLRCLIDKVVLQRAVRDRVQARIVWRGGADTTLEIPLAVGAFSALSEAAELEEKMLALIHQGWSDAKIAEYLSEAGYRSPRSERVIASTVRNIRLKHEIHLDRRHPHHRPPGHLSIAQLSQTLDVPQHWIYYLIRERRILVQRDPQTKHYLFPARPETIEQLKKLKAGEIQIVRL
jgi:DNA invertase Pin-like site-specific DNA recombinase